MLSLKKSFCTHCSYEIILCMYPILEKVRLSEAACLLKIKAPHIAEAEPGQFVMVQHRELAERIPLAILSTNEEGFTCVV